MKNQPSILTMLVPKQIGKEMLVPTKKLVQLGGVEESPVKQISCDGLSHASVRFNPDLDVSISDHLVSVEDNPQNTQ